MALFDSKNTGYFSPFIMKQFANTLPREKPGLSLSLGPKPFGASPASTSLQTPGFGPSAIHSDSSFSVFLYARKVALSSQLPDFSQSSLACLTDYTEKHYHTPLRQRSAVIIHLLWDIQDSSDKPLREIMELEELFTHCTELLLLHFAKEALILFPYILTISADIRRYGRHELAPTDQLMAQLQTLKAQLEMTEDLMEQISQLTMGYSQRANPCSSYPLLLDELRELHFLLLSLSQFELQVLFPKIIRQSSAGLSREHLVPSTR